MLEMFVYTSSENLKPAAMVRAGVNKTNSVKMHGFTKNNADRKELAIALRALACLVDKGELRLDAHSMILLDEKR